MLLGGSDLSADTAFPRVAFLSHKNHEGQYVRTEGLKEN